MYTKKVTIQLADIYAIIAHSITIPSYSCFRIEHVVEDIVRKYVEPSISLEDFTLYVGTIATLIWTNRSTYIKNTPLSLSVQQTESGSFVTKIHGMTS